MKLPKRTRHAERKRRQLNNQQVRGVEVFPVSYTRKDGTYGQGVRVKLTTYGTNGEFLMRDEVVRDLVCMLLLNMSPDAIRSCNERADELLKQQGG